MKAPIKFLILLNSLVFSSLLGFDFIDNCLEEYAEAFKKFETEAPNVKVNTSTEQIGNLLITTRQYAPATENLKKYLEAYKKLDGIVLMNALIKGSALGALFAILHHIEILPKENLISRAYWICGLIACAFLIIYENRSMSKVPYFDLFTMKRSKNIFSTLNSFKQIYYMGISSFVSFISSVIILAKIGKLPRILNLEKLL